MLSGKVSLAVETSDGASTFACASTTRASFSGGSAPADAAVILLIIEVRAVWDRPSRSELTAACTGPGSRPELHVEDELRPAVGSYQGKERR